jgi:hypothetical protein
MDGDKYYSHDDRYGMVSRRSQLQSWFRTLSATVPDFVPVTEVCFEKRFFPPK